MQVTHRYLLGMPQYLNLWGYISLIFKTVCLEWPSQLSPGISKDSQKLTHLWPSLVQLFPSSEFLISASVSHLGQIETLSRLTLPHAGHYETLQGTANKAWPSSLDEFTNRLHTLEYNNAHRYLQPVLWKSLFQEPKAKKSNPLQVCQLPSLSACIKAHLALIYGRGHPFIN